MDKLGKKLQEERLKRNIELQDISNATHISIGVLRDIENGNFTKYKGDEEYIKMYLRKYSEYLGMDSREYVQDYITLTDAYKLSDIEESQSSSENSPAGNGKKKVSGRSKAKNTETKNSEIKNKKNGIKIANPKFAKSKKVYEDQSTSRYIRYFIIVLLIVGIIGAIYFGISLMGSNSDKSFKNENTFVVTGDVSENTKEEDNSKDTDQESNQEDADQEDADQSESSGQNSKKTNDSGVSIEKTGSYEYTATIPADQDTFTIQFDFVTQTWCSLSVNGAPYSGFEARTYNEANTTSDIDATPETIELTFNSADVSYITLTNGYNIGHHYYIDGVEVPLDSSEEIGTVAYITFKFVRSEAAVAE